MKKRSLITKISKTIINKGVLKFMQIIFNFIFKYFFDALLIFVVGMFSKTLIRYFGNDRAEKIQEAIMTAMLWAEQEFGLGQGNKKFQAAWNKIVELLKIKGIKLSGKEILVVKDQIQANVPEINSIAYSSMPDKLKEARYSERISTETKELINQLRIKYPEGQE